MKTGQDTSEDAAGNTQALGTDGPPPGAQQQIFISARGSRKIGPRRQTAGESRGLGRGIEQAPEELVGVRRTRMQVINNVEQRFIFP